MKLMRRGVGSFSRLREKAGDEGSRAPRPPPPRLLRRLAWLFAGVVALLVLLLVSAAGGLWWSVRSDPGTAWLLAQLPGVKVSGGKGTLVGDFEAERVEFRLPGGGSVVMTGFGWHGLRIQRFPWTESGTLVAMSELHATRVDLQFAESGKKAPPQPPAHLRTPLELDVAVLHVGELHAAALGDKPVRSLQARLHLGADGGAQHRVDDLTLAWDRLSAKGAGRIATRAPMALELQIDATQNGGADTTAWSASAAMSGPLAEPALRATVRARAGGTQREQSLDARASLRPFAAWPLAELQASTKALDLSAFHSAAPVTALSGEATARSTASDQPASVNIRLGNSEAGRWNEARLPLRLLALELRGRPDDPRTLELQAFDAELGTREQSAGHVRGQGRWTPKQWTLAATLDAVQPSLLDARAAAIPLSGAVSLAGTGFGEASGTPASLELKADLAGRWSQRGAARPVQLKLDASVGAQRVELREARALAGSARVALSGSAHRDSASAPWQAKGELVLADFDPLPWWPGREDSAWRKGPHRLNAKGEFELSLPVAPAAQPLLARIAAWRGHAGLRLGRSLLAGVPLQGEVTLRNDGAAAALLGLKLDAAGNQLNAEARLAGAQPATIDQWQATLAAPALKALAPLWRLAGPPAAEAAFAGAINATARASGRWPDIATQGQLDGSELQLGATSVRRAQLRWQLDRGANAAVDAQASIERLAWSQAAFKGMPPVDSAQLELKGSLREHSLALRAESRARPPAWTDAVQPPPAAPSGAASAPAARTLALLQAQGGFVDTPTRLAGWRGNLQQVDLRSSVPNAAPWLRAHDVGIALQWSGGPPRATVEPARAEVLGAALRWSRVAWQGAFGRQPAQLDAQAELEPLAIAPLLARVQPEFGWGGDLAIAGHLNVRSAPTFSADVVLERHHGDLTVTEETGTQALGLTDLRLGLDARDGVWNFTQALAGQTLGVAAGAVVARTSPQAAWPDADTPIQGVLEVQVANLGTWGPWVPPGWRLTGALRTSASIGGRFGAPEYQGEMRGSGLGVRNFLQGVNVSDGELAIALQGSSARIERFSARAGSGTLRLEGSASLGEAPKALLKVQADKFQLLGRVDRRIVTSGQAQLQLDRDTLALDGKFAIDEGLIDFTRSDAPRLSDDVQVIRRKRAAPSEPADTPSAPNANPLPQRKATLNLQVALGDQLRLRGHGLDSGLSGELRITSPGGRLAVNGTVRASDGTYDAYGQKLAIDRGQLSFNGPVENPRLDIEATRPNTDVRVGVLVTGTALNPRVRLFSEPEMSEIDKLSWLVLGRASEGLGRTDTALLQRAAMALLAGEGGGATSQVSKLIGLDDVSLRQTEGEVRETVVTLGKQLSRRWYVGYERGLNATTGSWQLIYRIARRFTLRAQSGADNSVDVIWTWRWQ